VPHEVRPPVGPIQVAPPGLINLLQLKSSGYNPDAMRQDVQPTVDLEEWWLRAQAQNITTRYRQSVAGATAVNGFFAALSPGLVNLGPGPRAWWYIHTLSVIYVAAAAVTFVNTGFALRGGPQPAGGAADQSWLLPGRYIPAMGAANLTEIDTISGFWLPPNGIVGAYVGATTGAFELDVLGCRYTELPI